MFLLFLSFADYMEITGCPYATASQLRYLHRFRLLIYLDGRLSPPLLKKQKRSPQVVRAR